jgi:hypothetical protein
MGSGLRAELPGYRGSVVLRIGTTTREYFSFSTFAHLRVHVNEDLIPCMEDESVNSHYCPLPFAAF